ncbi:hypothetical protein Hanom_Chr05g00395481 [Helianthus anomalus]
MMPYLHSPMVASPSTRPPTSTATTAGKRYILQPRKAGSTPPSSPGGLNTSAAAKRLGVFVWRGRTLYSILRSKKRGEEFDWFTQRRWAVAELLAAEEGGFRPEWVWCYFR